MSRLRSSPFRNFKPPFCPRSTCQHHLCPSNPDWWIAAGFHSTRAFGEVPRFRCRSCGKGFSVQTFRVDFYAKCRLSYRKLHELSSASMSIRALSRFFRVSCGTVLNKMDRLARQCLAAHSSLRALAFSDEAVCIDGFQSFDVSQYFPNNITLSVSADSLLVLEATHATLRRSGAMTERQKARRRRIDRNMTYEKRPIERSFAEILDQIADERLPQSRKRAIVITDQKREYDLAFACHRLGTMEAGNCQRVKIHSRAARTQANPLFPVNYLDRLLRKDQAAHRRETACHSKSPSNCMSRFWCYACFHNYRKRFRIKAGIGDKRTHADVAGIPAEIRKASINLLYEARAFLTRSKLSHCGEMAWRKAFPTPLAERENYLPAFALA